MINKVRSIHKELISNYSRLTIKAIGFTMAEILLSLTIIGVVAAITLPSLTGNINERTWNTQRKALYSRMSQAVALMPALNGYGTLNATTDNTAETFVTSGLSKVLKVNNICENLQECGLPAKITTYAAEKIDLPTDWETLNPLMLNAVYTSSATGQTWTNSLLNAKAVGAETANGESLAIYYQPYCQADMMQKNYMIQPKVCVNIVFDLNGKKGPNTLGKDVGFMSVLYPSDSSVVMPLPVIGGLMTGDYNSLVQQCRNFDNARLPIREELASMFVNQKLLGDSLGNISATPASESSVYHLDNNNGMMAQTLKSIDYNRGWCVHRN